MSRYTGTPITADASSAPKMEMTAIRFVTTTGELTKAFSDSPFAPFAASKKPKAKRRPK